VLLYIHLIGKTLISRQLQSWVIVFLYAHCMTFYIKPFVQIANRT